MIVHKFKCTTESGLMLLVPTKDIPVAAKNACAGEWKYDGELSEDLKEGDVRLALDSKQAIEDINKQGFHIFRYSIKITERVIAAPKKKK